MDLNFNKVTYDGELSDFSEDELRETIREFETAQESNVAEFEKAAEATDGVDESTIEDFEDAREDLIEDITEAEAFDEVPLTEDKLEDEDFSDLQDWKAFVAETDTDEADEGDGEGDFDDMGQEAPTNPDEDSEDFVEDQLGEMPGFSL
jgi:sulfite reductase alpha subunit-like flavoprotein